MPNPLVDEPAPPAYQDNEPPLSPHESQTQTSSSGYTPVQYDVIPGQDPQDFYGVLIDPRGRPSEILCRMADALFFYMDQHCNQLRGTQRVEPAKVAWLSVALSTDESIRDAAKAVTHWNISGLYDAANIPYTLNEERAPVLDRRGHLHLCVFEIKADPDDAHQQWNKIMNFLGLQDPATGLPFPTPLPRSAFPPIADLYLRNMYTEWQAKAQASIASRTPRH